MQESLQKSGFMASISHSGEFAFLNSMEDFVRIVDASGKVLFENEALLRYNEEEGGGRTLFPLTTATGPFLEQAPTMTELCVAGHAYSLKNSPLFQNGRVHSVIQVFRDTTVQNNMTLQLLQANRKLKNELALARTIQTEMLPKLTSYGHLHFDYRYLPTNELSGDFFDFIPLGQGRLGLYISDVVGHGASASMLTMFLRQTMRSILEEEKIREPANVLGELRGRFHDIHMDDTQYFSLFYAVFDTIENTVTYANAGHNCVPLVENGGKIEQLKAAGRLITARQLQYAYKQHTRQLQQGDRFLFYTDGAVETMNATGMLYGEENLKKMFLASHEHTLDDILNDINHFVVGEQKDDIALVYVENRRNG